MKKAQNNSEEVQALLTELEGLGNEKMKKHHLKAGAGPNTFGVKMGDIRNIAKRLKTNHELALQLWQTGNVDARFLSILLMKPAQLSAKELNELVVSETFVQVADWLYSYVIKEHADKETLRQKWMHSEHPMEGRAGWSLTAGRVARSPEGLDLKALLNRIEKEMANAAPAVQWTMNSTLANIGIHFPEHRKQALEIGETLGVYRDYPTSKGCTSPFAPIWIEAMVSRQGK